MSDLQLKESMKRRRLTNNLKVENTYLAAISKVLKITQMIHELNKRNMYWSFNETIS